MTYLWALPALASLAGIAYLMAATLAVRRFAAREPPEPIAVPPVTVLKPLHGADWRLADNLRRAALQDGASDIQIVCGVSDSDDPAVAVVERLRSERSPAEIVLVVDPRVWGTNLKISNLVNMMAAARHDLLVLADSDMRVGPGYLAAVTAPLLDPAIGLVTCVYVGRPAAGLWSRLGAMHVNHGFLPAAIFNERIRPGDAAFGATIALRRETLQALGGFEALRDQLADDYALGAAVRRLGLRVVLAPEIVETGVDEPSLAALLRHELRWARTIRLIAPAGHAGSVVTHPVALGLAAALLGGFTWVPWVVLVLAMAARLAMVRAIDRALGLPATPSYLVPVRDLLSFAVFVGSFCGRSIAWRDRRFRLLPDGRLILDGDPRQ